MKNNKLKKFLVACTCTGILLTGGLTLSGCSLSDEQQKALDVLVENTETLVTDFGSYLDGQNAKIDKEKAVDMIEKSRLNFLMNNFNNLEMNVNMKMYEGFEDKSLFTVNFKSLYKSENGIKTYAYFDDGKLKDLNKSNFNTNTHYSYSNYTNESFKSDVQYNSGSWSMHSADIFSQSPLTYIKEITEDDIYNINPIDDGYEFEIVTKVTTITETDLSKYKNDDEAIVFNLIMKVEIKNDYIAKVDFKGTQVSVPVKDLMTEMTGENTTIILDGKGIPTVSTYSNATIVTNIISVDYKYENIDYTAMDVKVAEIEAKYLSQQ